MTVTTSPSRFRAIEPEHFPWLEYRRYTFSLGLEHAGAAVLSGHVASAYDEDAGGVRVHGGLADQADTAWAKIEAILGAAGLGLADVRRVVQYVRSDRIHEFSAPREAVPDGIGVGVPVSIVPVTRLLRAPAIFEVEVIAGRAGGHDPLRPLVFIPPVAVAADAGALRAAHASAYEQLAAALESRSLSLEHVAQVRATLVGHDVDALLGLAPPAAVRAGVGTLAVPECSDGFRGLRLDAVAVDLPVEQVEGGVISAVQAGRLLFSAGPAGKIPDLLEATRSAYEAVAELTAARGGQLIKTVEFVDGRRLDAYRDTAAIRRELLDEPWPAATGVVCERVSTTGSPLWVEAIAVVGEDD